MTFRGLTRHVGLAAAIGLGAGVWGEISSSRGIPLLGLIVAPSFIVGGVVCRFGLFGVRAAAGKWVWLPFALVVAAVAVMGQLYDGFWNDFTGGYCGDFRCAPNLIVTDPLLAGLAYFAGAVLGLLNSVRE